MKATPISTREQDEMMCKVCATLQLYEEVVLAMKSTSSQILATSMAIFINPPLTLIACFLIKKGSRFETISTPKNKHHFDNYNGLIDPRKYI